MAKRRDPLTKADTSHSLLRQASIRDFLFKRLYSHESSSIPFDDLETIAKIVTLTTESKLTFRRLVKQMLFRFYQGMHDNELSIEWLLDYSQKLVSYVEAPESVMLPFTFYLVLCDHADIVLYATHLAQGRELNDLDARRLFDLSKKYMVQQFILCLGNDSFAFKTYEVIMQRYLHKESSPDVSFSFEE